MPISVSDDAYRDYAAYVALTHPVFVRNRKRILGARLFISAFFAFGLFFASESVPLAAISVAVGALWSWTGWSRYPGSVAQQQVAVRATASSHVRLAERQFTANDDSITVADPQMRLELKWPAIRCWGEAPSCFFFSTSPGQAIIVPKSALTTEALEQLRVFAGTKLGAPTDVSQRVQRRAA